MTVSARSEGRVVVLEVSGDIDGRSAPALQEQLLPRIEAEGRVLLDLKGVGFRSSAGLRALLLTHREAGSKRAQLVLVGLSQELRATMSATGFLRYFTVCESLADGLSALG